MQLQMKTFVDFLHGVINTASIRMSDITCYFSNDWTVMTGSNGPAAGYFVSVLEDG